ncbi:hypothetical protein HDV03_004891 [Kappamyces sp. JEL0829]|nr:hypothetical protein HDV03_004891 [Kappamyces sp. JEL0829]
MRNLLVGLPFPVLCLGLTCYFIFTHNPQDARLQLLNRPIQIALTINLVVQTTCIIGLILDEAVPWSVLGDNMIELASVLLHLLGCSTFLLDMQIVTGFAVILPPYITTERIRVLKTTGLVFWTMDILFIFVYQLWLMFATPLWWFRLISLLFVAVTGIVFVVYDQIQTLLIVYHVYLVTTTSASRQETKLAPEIIAAFYSIVAILLPSCLLNWLALATYGYDVVLASNDLWQGMLAITIGLLGLHCHVLSIMAARLARVLRLRVKPNRGQQSTSQHSSLVLHSLSPPGP